MSADSSADISSSSCASCGIAEIDNIKLKECDDCDLVKYCSDECQKNHRLQHNDTCKKRAAELRDETLFKQPESSHSGDCPICFLPLPLEGSKTSMTSCCYKIICIGCVLANKRREVELRLKHSCPFCREPVPVSETKVLIEEEVDQCRKKRIEANDPFAVYTEGMMQYEQGEYGKAFEYYTKAAQLGMAEAHHQLSVLYFQGEGVEKDMGKQIYHAEEAAIGGHAYARCNLGSIEWNNGNVEKTVKHFVIAATQGYPESIKMLMEAFKRGFVSKEDLAAALRAHQAAVDATKSPQREEAEKYLRTSHTDTE